MELASVRIEFPKDSNIIVGQSHFIKTVEDLYEVMIGAVPGARFGVAFSEASGPCLIRHDGNDEELTRSAVAIMESIGAGHTPFMPQVAVAVHDVVRPLERDDLIGPRSHVQWQRRIECLEIQEVNGVLKSTQ